MATLEQVRAQADAALGSGDHKTALSLALLMQRHFPRDYQTMELLGKIYLETRQVGEAIDAFHQVLDVDPEDVVAWSALAMIAEEEGDRDGALEYFERAFDIDPGNPEIASEIARLHSQLNHTKAPEPGSSMHSMARRFLIEGKFESAVPWLQEALRITPEATEVAAGLGRALWLSWRPKEAEDIVRELLVEHPDCLPALAVAAGAAYSRGGEETLALLNKTAELNPGNSVARSLFSLAGIVFPARSEHLSIPDLEIQEALAGTEGEREASSWAAQDVADVSEPTAESEDAGAGLAEAEARRWPDDEIPRSDEAAVAEPLEETANPLLKRLATSLKETPDHQGAGSQSQQIAELVFEPRVKASRIAQPASSAGSTERAEPGQCAQDHVDAAASFADQGLLDQAISEYREALKKDPSVAAEVSEAAIALAEANPSSVKARWLAGDVLAMDGKFRRAVDQYIQVLKASSPTPPGPSPDEVQWQD